LVLLPWRAQVINERAKAAGILIRRSGPKRIRIPPPSKRAGCRLCDFVGVIQVIRVHLEGAHAA